MVQERNTPMHVAFLLDGEEVCDHIEQLPHVIAEFDRNIQKILQVTHIWTWEKGTPDVAARALISIAHAEDWSDKFLTPCLCNPYARKDFGRKFASHFKALDGATMSLLAEEKGTLPQTDLIEQLLNASQLTPRIDLLINTLPMIGVAGCFTLECEYAEWYVAGSQQYDVMLVQSALTYFRGRDRRMGAVAAE